MATETKPVPGAPDSMNGLEQQGLRPSGQVHWNLVAPELMLAAARRGEGEFADMGPFVAVTSPHTCRSPNDKFVVREPSTEGNIDWGKVNAVRAGPFRCAAGRRARVPKPARAFVAGPALQADPAHRHSVRYGCLTRGTPLVRNVHPSDHSDRHSSPTTVLHARVQPTPRATEPGPARSSSELRGGHPHRGRVRR